MPDEHFALRQVDQLRTEIANLECGLEFLDAADQSAAERTGFVAGG
jgi:hypothetical protein